MLRYWPLFIFFLLGYVPGNAQNEEFERQENNLSFRNGRYGDFQPVFFSHRDGSVTLKIAPAENEVGFSPFSLYISLQVEDNRLPDLYFFNSNVATEEQKTFITTDFVRSYEDWIGVNHWLPVEQTVLYLHKMTPTQYVISGEVKFEDDDQPGMWFVYFGEVVPEQVEVKGITAYSPDKVMNNEGKMNLDGREVPAQYGLRHRGENGSRFYITDRFLPREDDMEYGVFFDFNAWPLPEGTFTPESPGQYGPHQVGFFDRNKTEYPVDYKIKVKTRQQRDQYTYKIDYELTLSDGRVVTGKYAGYLETIRLYYH